MAIIRPMKYNPAFLPQEELIRSFVVRNKELDLIMEVIHENKGRANQHILIVGPRGAGKTTLALRVAAEVIKNNQFYSDWYPIVFSEESYEICSPGVFWLEAIFHVGKHTKEKKWKEIYRELRTEKDDIRLRERALAKLLDFVDEIGKRLLIIVENLNVLMGEQISHDDAWTIRHTLLNEPRIMLLGTALNRFEQIENSDKAMFELFKIHELEPLDSDACRDLWKSVTGQELKGDCIRPVQILTGGSPRLLVIISSFAAKASLKELMGDLTYLVDEHTEYFKSHIDNLPALERKVYVTLADLWQPSTAREVADAARVDVNKASASLKRLVSRGAVSEVEHGGRKKWYQLAERMYNIYYLMRRRGEPSNRVRAVVYFMTHFYAEEELVKMTASIAEEACRTDLESREDHYQALIELLKTSQIERHRQEIIDKIPNEFWDSPDLPDSLKEIVKIPTVKEARFTEKELTTIRPNDSNNPNSWVELGVLIMKKSGMEKDAEYAFREALKLDPKNINALQNLAFLLVQTDRNTEAENIYKAILDIDPNLTWVWDSYGSLLQYKLKRFEDATTVYRKVIQLDPTHASVWRRLGDIFTIHFDRFEEAEYAYRKAIELDANNALSWNGLGDVLRRKNCNEEAEQAYRKSIELEPDNAFFWASLGALLFLNLEKFVESEEALKRSIDLDADNTLGWGLLGFLKYELEQYEEAEKTFKRAIEINPRDSFIIGCLGNTYRKIGYYQESEKNYYNSIEIDPNNISIWLNLVKLQMDNIISPKNALITVQKFIESGQRSAERLNMIAQTFYENRWGAYWEQAEKWSREAVEKAPDNAAYRFTLALILGEMKRWKEAIEISSLTLKDNDFARENIKDITRLYIYGSAAGYTEDCLKVLKENPEQRVLEPLVTGLKIFLGEKVRAPQEIMEIGKDVAKLINERMKIQTERSFQNDNP